MQLRPVEAKDSQTLLAWRNHPQTRMMSLNQAILSEKEHHVWFEQSMQNPQRFMWLAHEQDELLGICRFDFVDNENARVSIQVNPNKHNKGIGHSLLHASIDRQQRVRPAKSYLATVRNENRASMRLFQKFGFVTVSVDHELSEFRLLLAQD